MRFLLALSVTILFGCAPESSLTESDDNASLERGFAPADLAQVYFTNPGTEKGDETDIAMDDALIALIDGAKETIDLSIYDLDHPEIVDSLVAAHERGITVRMVGDADESDTHGYEALELAGVEQSLRTTSGIMHNKYVVVDERVVWTGSTNLTVNGLNRNNNDAVLLDSSELALEFTYEFEQMFYDEVFGGRKTDQNSKHHIPFNDSHVSVYFAPQHEPVDVMKSLLAEADHSALFMVFSFTHPDLSAAVEDAFKDGVEVAGILDNGQTKPWYSKDEELALANIPVYLDGNENASGFSGGKLHHKALIVDAGTDSDPFVVTGSFNWSKSADTRNDENLIVIREPAIVNQYKAQWCALMAQSTAHPDYMGKGTTACISADLISTSDSGI